MYEMGAGEESNVYRPFIKQYSALTQPDNPPDNPGGQQTGGRKWCGKDHSGNFFQKIIGWFHNIFVMIFGTRY